MLTGKTKARRAAVVAVLAAVTAMAFHANDAFAEEKFFGDYEFRTSCAVCHGSEGLGNGPMAGALKPSPTNLTILSKNNGGVFPYEWVFKMIDGRGAIAGHGSGQMPIWGDRYSLDVKEAIVRARILELAYHLRSVQVD